MKHHPTKNLIQGLAFSLVASLGSASPAIAEDGIEVFGPLDGSFGDIQGENIIILTTTGSEGPNFDSMEVQRANGGVGISSSSHGVIHITADK